MMGGVAALVALLMTALNLSVSLQTLSRDQDILSFHSTNITRAPSETMSSCMLIMDDNHWLVEWLAYHFTTLNLAHMIVAIDPRSRTSPISILDRWEGRIDVEMWNDSHYFDNYPKDADLQEVNLARQQTFLAKCITTFKQRNHSWVMLTDTDEYVMINPRTKVKDHELYRPYSPPLDQAGSILSFLQQEQKTHGTTCFSMGRLQFSPDESSIEKVQRNVPPYLNASHFMTLRWLHPADDLVGPKNIVHLASIPPFIIPTNYTHQHRVIYEQCPEAGYTWHRDNSLLQIYHYLGTLQQFKFRNDARLSLEWAGRNERFDRYKGKGDGMQDDLRPWIKAFVDLVGGREAIRLLEGVGRTDGWESAEAHSSRFADEPCCISVDTESQAIFKFYSVAKTDRGGAAVADMLLAHAFAFANNMNYAGACAQGDLPHQKTTEQLIEAVGLQDVLTYSCPESADDGFILERQAYVAKNTRIFTESYLQRLRSQVHYPSQKNHSVVVHVRRGDVTPCSYYANRYLPNSHYIEILNEYVPPDLPVSIFSESNAFESFDDFGNYSVYLDTDLAEAWKAMLIADYIVLSKSSFSMVPAILNRNATVIYTPFMQKRLPQWRVVNSEIMENTRKKVLRIIEQKCTSKEKKIALDKLS